MMKTVFKRVLQVLCVLVIILVAVFSVMFGKEVATLNTLERVDDQNFYTMEFKADYGFDEFLAQGGASSDAEVVSFVVDYLLKGIPLDFELPDLGCSTIFVENSEGGYLFGRNFDMYDSPAVLLKTTPKNGYDSFTMVNLAYIGYNKDNLPETLMNSITTLSGPYAPMDGMNEKGLCMSVMLIKTDPTNQETDLPDITTSTAIRLVLEKAATVDEALELLRQYDMHSSAGSCYHFEIADTTGKAVVVEYIENEMTIVENNYATNFLLTKGDWQGFGGGHDRYAVLEETFHETNGKMNRQEVMDLLEKVSQKGSEDSDTTTQWSCVYDPTNLTVTVVYGMNYDNAHIYSLK